MIIIIIASIRLELLASTQNTIMIGVCDQTGYNIILKIY